MILFDSIIFFPFFFFRGGGRVVYFSPFFRGIVTGVYTIFTINKAVAKGIMFSL